VFINNFKIKEKTHSFFAKIETIPQVQTNICVFEYTKRVKLFAGPVFFPIFEIGNQTV
jgi:hypothetical protein